MNNHLPSVQLTLNGEPVHLMNFLATVRMSRESEDMSGQENSTSKADKGVKAKELHIQGLVPFNRREWLSRIFQLAESEDEKGNQTIYRIANLTAETVNLREGVFVGEVAAEEQNVQGWSVSFTLAEQNSVGEKKAKKREKPTAKSPKEKATKPKKTTKPKKSSTAKSKKGNAGDSGFTVFLD